MKTEVIHTTRKGKSISLFFSYFELFRTIDIFPIQTLIITLLRNAMLTVPNLSCYRLKRSRMHFMFIKSEIDKINYKNASRV